MKQTSNCHLLRIHTLRLQLFAGAFFCDLGSKGNLYMTVLKFVSCARMW